MSKETDEAFDVCDEIGNRPQVAATARAYVAMLERSKAELASDAERLADIMRRSILPIDHAADARSWEHQCEDARTSLLQTGARLAQLQAAVREFAEAFHAPATHEGMRDEMDRLLLAERALLELAKEAT